MQIKKVAKILPIMFLVLSVAAPMVVRADPPKNTNTGSTSTNTNTKPAVQTNANTNTVATDVAIPAIDNNTGASSVEDLVIKTIKILFLLIIIAAVVVIVVAGFRMVTGGNNPDQLAKAKKTIVWAIIGLIVAFMSYSIVEIIAGLLK